MVPRRMLLRVQLFECGHYFCDTCALAVFKERTKAPCPTCRADVNSGKIFQGTANVNAHSLQAWERPELAKVTEQSLQLPIAVDIMLHDCEGPAQVLSAFCRQRQCQEENPSKCRRKLMACCLGADCGGRLLDVQD